MNKPPCSEWGIWEGPEIEGHSQIGEMTLFVRRGDFIPFLKEKHYKRVWFCKEFCHWERLKAALTLKTSDQVFAIEIKPETIKDVPEWVKSELEVHYKWSVDPKKGDHICLGQPYSEFSFQLDEPQAAVNPDMYLNDVRLDGQFFIWYSFDGKRYYRYSNMMFHTHYSATEWAQSNGIPQREGWVHFKVEAEE